MNILKIFRDRYIQVVLSLALIMVISMYAVKYGNDPAKNKTLVSRVIDGDTVVLNDGRTVRLIGIDSPEIHHPELPVQRFGMEAMEYLKKQAEGRECRAEFDPKGDVTDKYGRSLAYLYVAGRLMNAEMIRLGYAYAYTRFPYTKKARFVELEKEARLNKAGLWSYTLRDSRIAGLIMKYDSLNDEGRAKFDSILNELEKKYPDNKYKN